MFRCWAEEPQDRPTFQQLYDDLNVRGNMGVDEVIN